jgi:hypothetical protein
MAAPSAAAPSTMTGRPGRADCPTLAGGPEEHAKMISAEFRQHFDEFDTSRR